MKKLITAEALFLLFVVTAGLWVGLLRHFPVGAWRIVLALVLGSCVVAVYLYLLVARLRRLLQGGRTFWLHLGLVSAELLLLLLGFAAAYQSFGVLDNTRPGAPPTHDFWTAAYLSLVTFTTLGYGDVYPTGPGRALAALQSLTGYLALAVLASSVAAIISPYTRAGPGEER